MKKLALITVMVGSLCGCGIAAKVQARQAYQQATTNYDNCLMANQNDVDACNADKQIMLSNEDEYNSLAAGIEPEGVHTLNMNSQ